MTSFLKIKWPTNRLPLVIFCHSHLSRDIWGKFSYDRKTLRHIWRLKTASEKKASTIELQKINEALEPELRENWELTYRYAMAEVHRNRPGRKSQLRTTDNNGAIQSFRYGVPDQENPEQRRRH